ncbi:spore germination protein KB [Paenibacillus phyllosphaerae]|uniref:Spore germination protein KB n=1 Tax=Paenibacillus phyllosphaerae TaxID=274593 RepID=A0A7W5B122_9BACL|nr:endospore germination permease [Paenibacillus phyllosphaerae]MBB3111741.1 spore germination protein KB [Paenibacillus phyllosphaerae]
MQEKGQISALQMGIMMFPFMLAINFLVYPTIAAQYAGNDFWLVGFFHFLFGSVIIYILTKLHKLYPHQTLSEYSEKIIGKFPAKLLMFLYLFYFLHSLGASIRQYAEFVTGTFLFRTPILLILISIVLLAAITVRCGVEVIARSATILVPLFVIPLTMLILLLPDLHIKHVMPILSHGIIPVVKATQWWIGNFIVIAYLLPYLSNPESGRKASMFTLTAVVVTGTYINLLCLMLLGPDTSVKIYPVHVLFRYVSFANFFENMEALLLVMWVVGCFIRVAVFYYVASVSLAQWLNLENYRSFVFPLGLLIVVFSLWDFPDVSAMGVFFRTAYPFEQLLTGLVIPLFLLLIALLRRKKPEQVSVNETNH